MNIGERIAEELKAAMKARDQTRMDTLRMIKSEFQKAQIEKRAELTDEEMLAMIQKSLKKRREAVEMFKTGGRQDLVDKESREMDVLKAYVPAQMGEDEIRSLAKAAIAESGATSKKDMGKVMGALMPKLKGKADGKLVQQVVSALLP